MAWLGEEIADGRTTTVQGSFRFVATYNVATTIDAVRVRDGTRELVPMRWGLAPSWWKIPQGGSCHF
jgi:putative SOS response-associated peptidase YedK